MNELKVAKIIWKRFANSSVEFWEDETHKAEYLDCATEIAETSSNKSADTWTITCRNKFSDRVCFAWALLFGWPRDDG